MNSQEVIVCDGNEVESLIAGMARSIWEGGRIDAPFFLVGVRSRGVPLAQRLAEVLSVLTGDEIFVGAVDITLYRDDLSQSRRWPVLLGTEIPFSVDGAELVLVDDVLFTGRTVRAALNAICDLGRPERIRLAVLVDRGHRQLPIQANVVGLHLPTALGDRVRVRLRPLDQAEEIVRVLSASGSAAPERRSAP